MTRQTIQAVKLHIKLSSMAVAFALQKPMAWPLPSPIHSKIPDFQHQGGGLNLVPLLALPSALGQRVPSQETEEI